MLFAHMPIIRDILYGAASRGASLKELCERLELSIEELTDSDIVVPFEKAYQSWELAVKQTEDPLLGLHLGEDATPSILGLIGHLMQSSPDLVTAYQQVCKHAALATNVFVYTISVNGDQTILRYKPSKIWLDVSRNSARQAVEQAMAGTINVFYLLSGKNVNPIRTELIFSKPKSAQEYERVFGGVSFNTKENALYFETSDLKQRIISYDKSLFALFDKLIQQKLDSLKQNSSLSDSIRRILTEDFKGRIVPAEVIATQLNMSKRTFQRKLKDEGTSYRVLSSALRKELAGKLLKKPDATVQEVARMLGYSEASALRKILKN